MFVNFQVGEIQLKSFNHIYRIKGPKIPWHTGHPKFDDKWTVLNLGP